jgi:hypothetical protein
VSSDLHKEVTRKGCHTPGAKNPLNTLSRIDL